MLKRGISSQSFLYLLSLVVIALILVIGYKSAAIEKTAMQRSGLIQLQSNLMLDIKSISSDYGRFKKITYSAPKNLDEVCFVDLSKKDEVLNSKLISFYTLIKDSLAGNLDKNIFFIGDGHSAYANFSIAHYPNMACFKKQDNKVEIGIEGLGNFSFIFLEFITKAKISKEGKTILSSADDIIYIEVRQEQQAACMKFQLR